MAIPVKALICEPGPECSRSPSLHGWSMRLAIAQTRTYPASDFEAGYVFSERPSVALHRLEHLLRLVHLGELLVPGHPAQVDNAEQAQQEHDAC